MTINEFLDRHILPQLENAKNGTDSDTSGSHALPSEKLGYLAQHRLFDQVRTQVVYEDEANDS